MKNSFNTIIASKVPILVDFFAEWCGSCKAFAPILKQVKESLGDEVKIVKIDVDKNQTLVSQLNLKGVPTLLLFKNRLQVWRQSGVLKKQDIINKIKRV